MLSHHPPADGVAPATFSASTSVVAAPAPGVGRRASAADGASFNDASRVVLWSDDSQLPPEQLERPHTSNPRYQLELMHTLAAQQHQQQPLHGGMSPGAHGKRSPPQETAGGGPVTFTEAGGVELHGAASHATPRSHGSSLLQQQSTSVTSSFDAAASSTSNNNGRRGHSPQQPPPNGDANVGVLWASEGAHVDTQLIHRPSTSNPWLARFLGDHGGSGMGQSPAPPSTGDDVVVPSQFDEGAAASPAPPNTAPHCVQSAGAPSTPGGGPPPPQLDPSGSNGIAVGETGTVMWSVTGVPDWRLVARPHTSNPVYETDLAAQSGTSREGAMSDQSTPVAPVAVLQPPPAVAELLTWQQRCRRQDDTIEALQVTVQQQARRIVDLETALSAMYQQLAAVRAVAAVSPAVLPSHPVSHSTGGATGSTAASKSVHGAAPTTMSPIAPSRTVEEPSPPPAHAHRAGALPQLQRTHLPSRTGREGIETGVPAQQIRPAPAVAASPVSEDDIPVDNTSVHSEAAEQPGGRDVASSSFYPQARRPESASAGGPLRPSATSSLRPGTAPSQRPNVRWSESPSLLAGAIEHHGAATTSFALAASSHAADQNVIEFEYSNLCRPGTDRVRRADFKAMYRQRSAEFGITMSDRQLDNLITSNLGTQRPRSASRSRLGSAVSSLTPADEEAAAFLTLEQFTLLYLKLVQW